MTVVRSGGGPSAGGGGSPGIVDPGTMDGDGSIGNPYNANPLARLDWKIDLLRRVQALYPAIGFNEVQGSNCNSLNVGDATRKEGIDLEISAAFGGSSDVVLEATNGGSLLVSTGVTPDSTRIVQFKGSLADTTPGRFVSNTRTQPWAVYMLGQAVAGAGTAGKVIRFANMWSGGDDNNFGWNGTPNWSMKIGAAAPLDLGVAADFNLHHFLMVNETTNVHAHLDWAHIGAAVSSAGLSTVAGFPRSYNDNGGAAENVSHRILRFAIVYVKPTPA